MALAKHTVKTESRVEQVEPTVVAQPRKHEIYDHNTTPLWSLDAFLQGSPWQVTYFRQRLGPNDTTKKLDPNSDPAYQSYDKIEKLELMVRNAITPSYRDRENLMEVTGTAVVFSTVLPNVDDYFIAQSNLSRSGLFRITNVNRLQHERESVFVIDYAIEEEVVEESLSFQDIMRKVVKTFVYSKQRMIENRNPLLLKETYQKLKDLHFHYKELVGWYFRDFFSWQSGTIQIPGQIGRHVDPFVIDFLNQIVSLSDSPILEKTRYVSLNNDPVYQKPNIWSILLSRKEVELSYCERKMGKIRPMDLETPFFATSGSYANADWVIKPFNVEDSNMSSSYINPIRYCVTMVVDVDLSETTNTHGQRVVYEDMVFSDLPQPLPLFKPVVRKDGYIFEDSFYDKRPSSVLEICLLDYIRGQPVRLDMLSALVDKYPILGRLEQFYFGPILMVLIKESERGSHV